jgi:hypothetical protein
MSTPIMPFGKLEMQPEAFEDFVNSQGVFMRHYHSLICPIGIQDKYDARSTHAPHDNCQNGMIFIVAGDMKVAFSNNSANRQQQALGEIDSSVAYMTFPIVYDQISCKSAGEIIHIGMYDKFEYLDTPPDVVEDEIIQAHRSGIDRARFPIVDVLHLVDANGVFYFCGTDFVIDAGRIKWIGNRPGVNDIGNGLCYSVRYTYRPFWLAKSLTKDIRVAQQEPGDGDLDPSQPGRYLQKMQMYIIAQREYGFFNEQNNGPTSTASAQTQESPNSGSYGTSALNGSGPIQGQ